MKSELTYHHIGIPTENPRDVEVYLEKFKMFVSGFETSRFGVEWIRFEADPLFPELVKTIPRVAFAIDDLEEAIAGREILIHPNSPSEGVTVAFVVENGAPIEFLEFDGPEFEVWPGSAAQ